ncbi:hypothetical protein SNOG_01709 [Parastagonospora nodorum SN15]|uniref:Uncharacterized protein n=1 Tax=Phaeosphaeria nodorum (strain SN15 / ATCC MYA-4574 / FGSC 10173) TaxID=321614 RepID=Q0V2Q5_PHANO|nr:hypothetical protein SNOG_01709 [Parastagonospora nodorum SN15]EAT91358.1 hypothetical protein SNOG_01709 [Parastagonospora nodorum SN15]
MTSAICDRLLLSLRPASCRYSQPIKCPGNGFRADAESQGRLYEHVSGVHKDAVPGPKGSLPVMDMDLWKQGSAVETSKT